MASLLQGGGLFFCVTLPLTPVGFGGSGKSESGSRKWAVRLYAALREVGNGKDFRYPRALNARRLHFLFRCHHPRASEMTPVFSIDPAKPQNQNTVKPDNLYYL
jgi:hypothetical protein